MTYRRHAQSRIATAADQRTDAVTHCETRLRHRSRINHRFAAMLTIHQIMLEKRHGHCKRRLRIVRQTDALFQRRIRPLQVVMQLLESVANAQSNPTGL